MLASVRDVPYFREENRLDIKIAYIHDFSPHNFKKFPQTPPNFFAHTKKSAGAEAAAARVVAAYEREDKSDHIARGKRGRAQHSILLATADYARHSSAFSVPRSILHKNIFVYLT